MIIQNGKKWNTLDNKIIHNGKQIEAVYRGLKQYYPGEAPYSGPMDVNFWRYDGTLLYSYTAKQFLKLTAMPEVPDYYDENGLHRLTNGRWTYDFETAWQHVFVHGNLDIGSVYETVDEWTNIDILAVADTDFQLAITEGGVSAEIDWGDGTVGTYTSQNWLGFYSSYTHTYAISGGVTVRFRPSKSVIFGHVSSVNTGFSRAYTAKNMCGPCISTYSAMSTRIADNQRHVRTINRVELGANISINNFAFYNLTNATGIMIPDNLAASIGSNSQFLSCRNMPIAILPGTALSGAQPRYVSGITYQPAFTGASGHTRLLLDQDFAALENQYSLSGMTGVQEITFPASTSFPASSLVSLTGMRRFHFAATTPPANFAAAFGSSLPVGCKIYVPSSSLEAYKEALPNFVDSIEADRSGLWKE